MINKVYFATWTASPTPTRQKSTEITDIKFGTFHYNASASEYNKYTNSGVFASYIEFEYYSSNGITVNLGDMLLYARVVDGYADFSGNTTREISIQYFNVVSVIKKSKTIYVLAYDDVVFLDADFSETLKANENNFPMSMVNLIGLAANKAGLNSQPFNQFYASLGVDWINSTVQYFYSDGITVRDIFKWASELASIPVFAGQSANLRKHIKMLSWAVVGEAPGYNKDNRYITCPGDGTYTHPNIPQASYPVANVWYKENGLEINDGYFAFDGVEILSSNGIMLASYYGPQQLNRVYQIKGNVLADNIVSFDAGYSFNAVAESIFISLNYLNGYSAYYKAGTVHIFPFRNPYTVGCKLYGVDSSGNYFLFPIMSLDLSDSDCVIKSINYENNNNDVYGKETVNVQNSLTAVWTKINQIEAIMPTAFHVTTVSGTTNQYGNLATGLGADCSILSIRRTDGTSICVALWGTAGNTEWYAHVMGNTAAAVTNTNVTLEIVYIQGIFTSVYNLTDSKGKQLSD